MASAEQVTLDAAIAAVTSVDPLARSETVPLTSAARRVLAAPATARIDIPQRDLSAMDGYAVRDDDLTADEVTLALAGCSFAGDPTPPVLAAGTVIKVATGAPVPDGADRVVMRERCAETAAGVRIGGPFTASRHIRRAGEDLRRDAIVLDAGTPIGPRQIVALAAADLDRVVVAARPRIALISIGDELREAGTAASDIRATPDSLSPALFALIADWGGETGAIRRVADDRAAIADAVRSVAPDSHAIVLIGAASRGDRDFAFVGTQDAGLTAVFRGIAMKPGKPAWFGALAGIPVLGLPGNPTAAMVVARLLLAPMLCALSGRDPAAALNWQTMRLERDLGDRPSVELIARGRRVDDRLVAVLDGQKASGQRSLADADLLVRVSQADLARGDRVQTLPF